MSMQCYPHCPCPCCKSRAGLCSKLKLPIHTTKARCLLYLTKQPALIMQTFCCCLPVRAGCFILSAFTAIFSVLISAGMWISLHNNKGASGGQKAVLIVAGIVWGLLFIFSLFGFAGTIAARRSLVLVYSWIVWVHWVLSSLIGSILIWSLFRSGYQDGYIQSCEAQDPENNTASKCGASLGMARGIFIGVFVFVQLISLYLCVVVNRYVKQLSEEYDQKNIRNMERTLANMSYAYTSQQNSFGTTAPNSK